MIVLTATAKISLGGSTMKPSHTEEQIKTLQLWKQKRETRLFQPGLGLDGLSLLDLAYRPVVGGPLGAVVLRRRGGRRGGRRRNGRSGHSLRSRKKKKNDQQQKTEGQRRRKVGPWSL